MHSSKWAGMWSDYDLMPLLNLHFAAHYWSRFPEVADKLINLGFYQIVVDMGKLMVQVELEDYEA